MTPDEEAQCREAVQVLDLCCIEQDALAAFANRSVIGGPLCTLERYWELHDAREAAHKAAQAAIAAYVERWGHTR